MVSLLENHTVTVDRMYRAKYMERPLGWKPAAGTQTPFQPPTTNRPLRRISAFFFIEESGNEPVKRFLRTLSQEERKLVGKDVRTAEYGWPIGMPTCRPLGKGLHEVRTDLPNRISRILFRVDEKERMILLHGFVKKTQETPQEDIDLANRRWSQHRKKLSA